MHLWYLHERLQGTRRLFIHDFRVAAAIGVFPQEKGRTQTIRMHVDCWVSLQDTPSASDRLADVVDYDFIRPAIQGVLAQGHIGLLEKLVDQTLAQLLVHPKVIAARVQAEKSEIYPDCAAAGVDLFRFRDDLSERI